MTSLREKAISGASWSLAGRMVQQGMTFIIGIILARLLTPEEYGLVAMVTIFIYISYVFVDSGFGSALVQRKICTNKDFSTIFYINILICVFVYILFFFSAPWIAKFYNQPELIKLTRVLSILIVLFALSIVQYSIIHREINFKLKAQIELIAQMLSGTVAIYMAYIGYGVWALVWKTLLNQIFVNIQLWLRSSWFPKPEFSKAAFKEMFAFSSRLLIIGIINRVYEQIYKLIIGKFFSIRELGLFTRADQFQRLPSQTISNAILGFTLPVFSKMQDEPERLRRALKKILQVIMFFNISAMLWMAVAAEPLIYTLLGNKWIESAVYLQLLAGVGLFYPMHLLNVQILLAMGRSDLLLKIEIIKKIIALPAIFLAIYVSIKAMIVGMIVSSVLSLMVNTWYTKRLIKFGIVEQFKSIKNAIVIALLIALVLFVISYTLNPYTSHIQLLFVLIIGFNVFFFIFAKLFKMQELDELILIVFKGRRKKMKKKKPL